jgi:hypothetical protein
MTSQTPECPEGDLMAIRPLPGSTLSDSQRLGAMPMVSWLLALLANLRVRGTRLARQPLASA